MTCPCSGALVNELQATIADLTARLATTERERDHAKHERDNAHDARRKALANSTLYRALRHNVSVLQKRWGAEIAHYTWANACRQDERKKKEEAQRERDAALAKLARAKDCVTWALDDGNDGDWQGCEKRLKAALSAIDGKAE